MENKTVTNLEALNALHQCIYENIEIFIKLELGYYDLAIEEKNSLIQNVVSNFNSIKNLETIFLEDEYKVLYDAFDFSYLLSKKAQEYLNDKLSYKEFLVFFDDYQRYSFDWKIQISFLKNKK